MPEFELADRIELLVEGELSTAERRSVLAEIERDSDQWRALAFAFLEHQKINNAVRSVQSQPNQPMASLVLANRNSSKTSSLLKTVAALAACVLGAFIAGLSTGKRSIEHDFSQADDASNAITVATNANHEKSMSPEDQVTKSIVGPQDQRNSDGDFGIVGYVRWQGHEGGVQLSPVFDGKIDDQWLEQHPPQVNQQMQRAMSRAGWQVEAARRLVSVNLASGDKFTIPMDDLRYRYIGRQVF